MWSFLHAICFFPFCCGLSIELGQLLKSLLLELLEKLQPGTCLCSVCCTLLLHRPWHQKPHWSLQHFGGSWCGFRKTSSEVRVLYNQLPSLIMVSCHYLYYILPHAPAPSDAGSHGLVLRKRFAPQVACRHQSPNSCSSIPALTLLFEHSVNFICLVTYQSIVLIAHCLSPTNNLLGS